MTGQGDIAPDLPQGEPGLSEATVAVYLIGMFVGLIVVVVVATMFMTAEYRRGLIRITLAASPRRGRVLAAKSLVVGAVTFAAGLVGAVGAVASAPASRTRADRRSPRAMADRGAHDRRHRRRSWPSCAVFALAVGAIVRRSVAAVTIVFAAIVVPYFLAAILILPVGVADWLLRVTPAAAFAVQQATPQYPQVLASYTPVSGFFPLTPLAGLRGAVRLDRWPPSAAPPACCGGGTREPGGSSGAAGSAAAAPRRSQAARRCTPSGPSCGRCRAPAGCWRRRPCSPSRSARPRRRLQCRVRPAARPTRPSSA